MKPTRRSQPYRKGEREQGEALRAMLRGQPFFLPNPKDIERQTVKTRRRLARRMRRRLF